MSYEFGFKKNMYQKNEQFDEKDYYFTACGWENTELFKKFSFLGEKVLVEEDDRFKFYEYKINVEKLGFIEKIYEQLSKNEHYNVIMKLCRFNDSFVDQYIEDLSVREMADIRLGFLLEDADYIEDEICIELFNKFEYGHDIIRWLHEGYQRMIKDGIKFVWLYEG